jgi:ABC-type glycerol-3-phosphate transport system permease component
MSAAILSSIVPVALYFVSQRWVVHGLVAGGVKG